MYYTLKDHQGSLTATVHGSAVERLSYDPWGRRRNTTDFGYDNVSHTFDRGYTGHEHYDDFDLINMNGRLYDPILGRMLSPDVVIQDEQSSQAYNRYSYCFNNPLRFIDPTGWLPGDGGSGGSLPHIIIGGQTNYILPEITIRPDDNPSLSNPHEKPNYPTYYYGGSPTDLPAWGDPSNGPSIGWSTGTGCGGGSGRTGNNVNNTSIRYVLSDYFQKHRHYTQTSLRDCKIAVARSYYQYFSGIDKGESFRDDIKDAYFITGLKTP